MARNSDDLADSFATEEPGGWLTRLLADEEELDNRAKWRLASWAAGSLGALVVAILASQTSLERRRDQVAAVDLARQSQQIQRLARESQSEATRLASAIDTLNADRDRLYSRLGSLEQNLDSVTGSIARTQPASKPPAGNDKALAASLPEIPVKDPTPPVASVDSRASQTPAAAHAAAAPAASPPKRAAEAAALAAEPATPPPALAPAPPAAAPAQASEAAPAKPEPSRPDKPVVAAIAAMPPQQALMAARSMLAPPDAGATKLNVPPTVAAPAPPEPEPEIEAADQKPVAVPRTSFGVELGGANSVDGLRNLWRRMAKAHKELNELRPIIMVKENASGGQLRLVAGPLDDAAAAARLCAALGSADRSCETTVFDGQRLPLASSAASPPPRQPRKRPPKVTATVPAEPPPAPEPPPTPPQPKPGPLSSILGIR